MSLPWSSRSLKASPVAADEVLIIDSEDANPATQNKRITLGSFGTQTPWLQNIDAAAFDLLNLGGLEINNPGDTFQYVFVTSAITADRNVTLPLLTSNDTFVFEAHTQTLTNKTIDADNNTITNVGSSEVNSDIITGQTLKGIPVAADQVLITDSEDSDNLKRITLTDLLSLGTQTPWLQDIDADGFDLTDLSNVEFRVTTGAPAAASTAIYGDTGGSLAFNIPTATAYNFHVNDVLSVLLNDSSLTFLSSQDINGAGNVLISGSFNSVDSSVREVILQRNDVLADDTPIAEIEFQALDGGATQQNFARIEGVLESDVVADEDGSLKFYVTEAGLHDVLFMSLNDGSSGQIEILKDMDYSGNDIRDISNIEFQNTTGAPGMAVPAIWNDATGMKFNEPTGDNFIFSVNGVTEYTFDALAFDVNSNNLSNVGRTLMVNRFEYDKGANVSSSLTITLGDDGNVFDIIGTNTINEIAATNWQAGSVIHLQFDDALTVTNNSGGTNDILLADGMNFDTAAGDVLTLYFEDPDWREISRSTVGEEGNVTGPGSSTDEAIVRWDGITGTLVQNSTVTITDTGIVSGFTFPGTSPNLFEDNGLVIENPAGTFEYTVQSSAITADKVITLPMLTSSDTFVFEAHPQTLTNKTINADNNTITNIGSSEVVSDIITGQASKATPVAADQVLITDSEDSDNLKRITLTDLLSAGAQTPWTSDIDADGFDLTDLSNIEFRETTGAPGATVPSIYHTASGININNPTGDDFDLNFNGVTNYTFNATQADFNSNNIVNLGTLNTHTIPGGTDTFALLTATQTFTNKTIDADNNTISNLEIGAEVSGTTVAGTTLKISGTGATGFIDFDEITTPANPATDDGRLYVADQGGTTTLFFRDSAGTETNLLAAGSQTPWLSDIDADGFDLTDLSNIQFRTTTGAPGASDSAIFVNASGNMQFNLPTGESFVWSINNVTEMQMTSTTIDVFANNIVNVGYLEDDSANPANSGAIRLGNSANIAWRNNADDNNHFITFSATDEFLIRNDATTEYQFSSSTADWNANDFVNVGQVAIGQAAVTAGKQVAITIPDDTINEGVIIQNTDGSIQLLNGTSTANDFEPRIIGALDGSARSFSIRAEVPVADDTGTTPLILLQTRQDDSSAIENRPLLGIQNLANTVFEVDENGDITQTIDDDTAAIGYTISNTDGSILIGNSTATADSFGPQLRTQSAGSSFEGLKLLSQIPVADDTGSLAVVAVEAQRVGNTDIVTRPIFSIRNNATNIWEIDTTGTVDMQGNLQLQATDQLFFDGGGDTFIEEESANRLSFVAGNAETLQLVNSSAVISNGQTSTSRTTGFLYIPVSAGVPTGTPVTEQAGAVAMVFDTTNNDLYVYDGSWVNTAGSGAQSPWTSDIDADGFDLTDLSNIEFRETTGAPAGTVPAIWVNSAGMRFNIPTGDGFVMNINGAAEYSFNATELDLFANDVRNFGYLESNATSPASLGQIRLGANQPITWRNNANDNNNWVIFTDSDNLDIRMDATTEYSFTSTHAEWNANNLLNVGTYTSSATNVGTTGAIRIGNGQIISWRNNANDGNETLLVDANDNFIFSDNISVDITGQTGIFRVVRDETLADDTVIGQIEFKSFDGLSVSRNYGAIVAVMESDVDASEDGSLKLQVTEAGIHNVDFITLNDGSSGQIEILKETNYGGTNIRNFGFIESNTASASVTGAIRLGDGEGLEWVDTNGVADDRVAIYYDDTREAVIFEKDAETNFVAPTLEIFNSETNDQLNNGAGGVVFYANQNDGTRRIFASISAGVEDTTNGATEGSLTLRGDGTNDPRIIINADDDTWTLRDNSNVEYSFSLTQADWNANNLVDLANLEFTATGGAPAGTVPAIWIDADDMNLNVPTGDGFNFSVNGTLELDITPSIVNAPNATFQENGTDISPIGNHDAWIPASAMWASTTNGATGLTQRELATNDVDIQVWGFTSTTADEYTQFTWTIPQEWNAGTITVEFFWTATGGSAGNVVWGIQATAFDNDNPLDAAWGTIQEVTDAWIANDDLHISGATPNVTIAGSPVAGEMVQFRVVRSGSDASDTFAATAELLGIRINYTTDSATV